MPERILCSQGDCIYNKEGDCDAAAIRVRAQGQGRNNTFCDSYTDERRMYVNHGEQVNRGGLYAAGDGLEFEFSRSLTPDSGQDRVFCSAPNCRHNSDYMCTLAGDLDVEPRQNRSHPVCASFEE